MSSSAQNFKQGSIDDASFHSRNNSERKPQIKRHLEEGQRGMVAKIQNSFTKDHATKIIINKEQFDEVREEIRQDEQNFRQGEIQVNKETLMLIKDKIISENKELKENNEKLEKQN